jgi:starch-binding outer membrane protein, SusD/RagB family
MTTIKQNRSAKILNTRRQYLPLVFLALIITAQPSCKKLVDIPPPTQTVTESTAYATDATAIGVLDGIYTNLTNSGTGFPFQGPQSIGLFAGLSSDELNVIGTSNPNYAYYRNDLAALTNGSQLWAPLYNYIYKCNAAIEGLQKSTTLTTAVKLQLLGEAKFMRAFFYFYLVNLFGDVPLALSTDPNANTLLVKSAKADVYNQIISDLTDAKGVMNSNYSDASLLGATSERVRPTKWAATALLARIYLYINKYDSAELNSTEVIDNPVLYDTVPLNNVFLKNKKEVIWHLQPTTNNLNTADGRMYIIPATGPSGNNNFAKLSKFLLNSFEANDKRAALGNWINRTIYNLSPTVKDTIYFPFKYKVGVVTGVTTAAAMTEYIMVLRLGEQYLIRAEARAQQNNISGAQADLNVIRRRAGLTNTTASDQPSLLAAILDERRHELFCEWGHRWLDLKRTGKVDEVMNVITPLKSNGAIQWRSYQQYYPIAKTELDKTPNLEQTDGY